MSSILLTFSDGSTLTLKEEQRLVPIVSYKDNESGDRFNVSKDKTFEIWLHIHDGLIPSICEFLVNCEFFHLLDDNSTVYNSKAVVKIQTD